MTALTITSETTSRTRAGGAIAFWKGTVEIDGETSEIDVRSRVGERPIEIRDGALHLPEQEVQEIIETIRARRAAYHNLRRVHREEVDRMLAEMRAEIEQNRSAMPELVAKAERILDGLTERELQSDPHVLRRVIEERMSRP